MGFNLRGDPAVDAADPAQPAVDEWGGGRRGERTGRTLPTQSAVLDGVYHCSLTPLAAALAFFTAIKNPVAATA